MAENVNITRTYQTQSSPRIRQTFTATEAQRVPRVLNPGRVSQKKGFKPTTYEWIVSIVAFLIAIVCLAANLAIQTTNQSIERSVQQMQTQTVELRKQTDILRNNLMEQYNYDAIKQAAQKQGMQVRPGSVKDLSK